jgi:bifunctional non-homologous end joining protein LigD
VNLQVSHPQRVMFPREGITKGDVVDYYCRVAPVMVPHLRNRPLMLERYRAGIDQGGFYQKEAGDVRGSGGAPRGLSPAMIRRVDVPKAGGVVHHPVVDDEDGLVYLANQGCLTFHCWLPQADRLRQPDRLIVDLDPPATAGAFSTVRATALRLRKLFEQLGLTAFVQTTGSRGLHVVAPITPGPDNDEVLAFAHTLAEQAAASDPGRLTTEFRKAKRGARLYLDVARNGYAQTVVAPYTVRARPGAPVATPLDWDEVRTTRLTPDRWTIGNIFRRLGAKADPWRGMNQHARPLSEAWPRLERLTASRAS